MPIKCCGCAYLPFPQEVEFIRVRPSSGEQVPRDRFSERSFYDGASQRSIRWQSFDCDRRSMQSELHSDGAGGWPTSPERATDRHKRGYGRPVPRACQYEPQFAILSTSPLAQNPRWWKLSSNSGNISAWLGVMPCFMAASDNGRGT
jgi:hypothetical protein